MTTDWAKLTVAKLKEACVERDVSITGLKLKQQFVDKLAEWEEAQGQVEEGVQEAEGEDGGVVAREQAEGYKAEGVDGSVDAAMVVDDEVAAPASEDVPASNDAERSDPVPASDDVIEGAPEQSATEGATEKGAETNGTHEEVDPAPKPDVSRNESTGVHDPQPEERSVTANVATTESTISQETLQRPSDDATEQAPGALSNSAQEEVKEENAIQPPEDTTATLDVDVQPQITDSTRSSSMPPVEVLEDSRKRKRRSVTPAPQAEEVALKRAKANDGSPVHRVSDAKEEQAAIEKAGIDANAGPAAHAEPSREGSVAARSASPESPTRDIRKQSFEPEPETQATQPSIHAATPALYLRNFKRPLRAPDLQAHITSLANPSDSVDSPIKYFYLDVLRTHAFVVLDSTSSAARVRAALHDTRWPDEPTRDLLWVDYIPEEKAKAWADQELDASTGSGFGGGRSGPQKRWEVSYRDNDGVIEAILQDENAPTGPRRQNSHTQQRGSIAQPPPRQPSFSAATAAAPGVHPDRIAQVQPLPASPTGPARRQSNSQQDRAQAERNFAPLNSLFPSTQHTKPKLYYKPVSSEVVARRMEMMKDLRVGHNGMGRSGQSGMKRYTFEKDGRYEVWVDKGPEFGHGKRGRERLDGFGGAEGGRGRGGGGYRGGGRGGGRGGNRASLSPPGRMGPGGGRGGSYQDWDAPPARRGR